MNSFDETTDTVKTACVSDGFAAGVVAGRNSVKPSLALAIRALEKYA